MAAREKINEHYKSGPSLAVSDNDRINWEVKKIILERELNLINKQLNDYLFGNDKDNQEKERFL